MLENERQGVIWAIGAYLVWGVLPIYWKWLGHVPSSEILTSRVLWAFVFTLLFVVVMRNSKQLIIDIQT